MTENKPISFDALSRYIKYVLKNDMQLWCGVTKKIQLYTVHKLPHRVHCESTFENGKFWENVNRELHETLHGQKDKEDCLDFKN